MVALTRKIRRSSRTLPLDRVLAPYGRNGALCKAPPDDTCNACQQLGAELCRDCSDEILRRYDEGRGSLNDLFGLS